MALKTEPLVSIGMPVLNCERTIALSVASVLNQHYQNWELLVVDDGSQDRTVEILRSFADDRIRVTMDHCHRGIPVRRNQLVALARGEYFAMMDGDDIAYPDRLQRQVAYLQEHPEVDLLGASMVIFRGDGKSFGLWRTDTTHDAICGPPWASMRLAQPTWIGCTTWFRQNRYCEEVLSGAEDRELLSRTWMRSRFAALPDVLMGYREERLSLAKSLPRRRDSTMFLFRHNVSRRRYAYAALTVGAEIAKSLLDIIAVVTRLGYRVVPYRSRTLEPAVITRWNQVWEQTCGTVKQHQPALTLQ